jgi:hypothetical protein
VIGFVNYVVSRTTDEANPLKLLMLASGIGIWWFALACVENLLLGVALFDICHDVQYLAIVWLYNCRRVSSNSPTGRFRGVCVSSRHGAAVFWPHYRLW